MGKRILKISYHPKLGIERSHSLCKIFCDGFGHTLSIRDWQRLLRGLGWRFLCGRTKFRSQEVGRKSSPLAVLPRFVDFGLAN
jgi:hypothetical protein